MAETLVFKPGVNAKPCGYKKLTISGATTLAGANGPAKAGANAFTLRVETANIRYRDDGTAPTATDGKLLEAGEELEYVGQLDAFQMIEVSGAPVVHILYYEV